MRLMICLSEGNKAIGVLDIFEFDPQNQRAGIGIMIERSKRRLGYATDALMAVERYAVNSLKLHQLWCNVEEENLASLQLFTSQGYSQVGRKEDWNYSSEGYKAEIMLQKIL